MRAYILTAKPNVKINGSKGNTFLLFFHFWGSPFWSQLTEDVGFNNGTLRVRSFFIFIKKTGLPCLVYYDIRNVYTTRFRLIPQPLLTFQVA